MLEASMGQDAEDLKTRLDWNLEKLNEIIDNETFWQDKSRKGLRGIEGFAKMQKILDNREYTHEQKWSHIQSIASAALPMKQGFFEADKNPIVSKFYQSIQKGNIADFYMNDFASAAVNTPQKKV
jgi:hypothetical protein